MSGLFNENYINRIISNIAVKYINNGYIIDILSRKRKSLLLKKGALQCCIRFCEQDVYGVYSITEQVKNVKTGEKTVVYSTTVYGCLISPYLGEYIYSFSPIGEQTMGELMKLRKNRINARHISDIISYKNDIKTYKTILALIKRVDGFKRCHLEDIQRVWLVSNCKKTCYKAIVEKQNGEERVFTISSNGISL